MGMYLLGWAINLSGLVDTALAITSVVVASIEILNICGLAGTFVVLSSNLNRAHGRNRSFGLARRLLFSAGCEEEDNCEDGQLLHTP
jgi:hypothetical protein